MSETTSIRTELDTDQPEEGFKPRGIGGNWLACFVCDGIKDGYSSPDLDEDEKPIGDVVPSKRDDDGISYLGGYRSTQPDMASFVPGKEAGERVVAMFESQGSKALLDYRESEPEWVQVKIGACEDHVPNLEKLEGLTRAADGHITPSIISEAIQLEQA